MRIKIKKVVFTLVIPILVVIVFLGGYLIMYQTTKPEISIQFENPGFEESLPGKIVPGWNITGSTEAFLKESDSHSGEFHLTQRGVGELIEVWQTVQGLDDGWYTLRVWVRSSGEQTAASVSLKDCGSEERLASVPIAPADKWMQIVVSNHVTGGNCTVSLASEGKVDTWVSFDEVVLTPGRAALSIMGADVSSLKKSEDMGGVYADENGNIGDALQILKVHGLNYIRLRVWVDPSDGYHDKNELLEMARRAKALDIKVLVDFHYSDTWADPGKQIKPKDWVALDFEGLKKALYDHTFDVCESLKAQGTPPDMVQLGNEINAGMLWPDGHSDNWDNLAVLLKEGYRAIKDCSPSTLVMLHIAEGGKNDVARWWFDNALQRKVPFDLIGVSYYRYWHGSLVDLQNNLNDITMRYKKDVIVVETAHPFTRDNNDRLSNIIAGQIVRGYSFSPAGQEKMLGDVMTIVRAVPNGHGLGVFYWDATWTAVPGNGWSPADPESGNGWENQALFDYQNKALPAMNQFKKP